MFSPNRQQIESSQAIRCQGCGAEGVSLWEGEGARRQQISVTDNFYERLAKAKPHAIELVCHACGAIQKEG
jgi:hypothetical protein